MQRTWIFILTYTLICLFAIQLHVGGVPCQERGLNCTACLSDGKCGFCDSCADHCHKRDNIHQTNCTECAKCMPGTLTGPKKGSTCRNEW